MARRVQEDRVQLTVDVNGKPVKNTLKDIRTEYRLMLKLRNEATRGSAEFKQYNDEAARLKQILDEQRLGFRGAQKQSDNFFGSLKKGLGIFAAISGAGAIVNFGKQLLGLSSQMDLLDQKAQTVFGESIGIVEEFAARNAAAMGLTRAEYLATATAAGDLLIPMGFQREEAAILSNELVGLSGALSEWTAGKIDSESASRILTKALLGEREELKQLGISIKESDVQQRLAAKGQAELTGQALEQAKAMATLELITDKSTDAQQAFAENTGRQVRIMAELGAKLGEIRDSLIRGLNPAISATLGFVNRLFGGTQKYSEALEEERVEINALIIRIGALNEENETRDKLIGELQKRYPSFLGDLEAEKVTNEQLRDRLKEVNQEYINKIILQQEDERIEEQTRDLAQEKRDIVQAEIELSKELAEVTERFNLQLKEGVDLQQQAEDIRGRLNRASQEDRSALSGGVFDARRRAVLSLNSLLADYIKATGRAREEEKGLLELQQQRQQLVERLGITETTPESGNSEPDEPSGLTAKEKERIAKEAAQREELARKNEENLAQQIQNLRAELEEDELKRRIAQIDLAANREIEALKGTEEQKAEATKLINERRNREILQALETDALQRQELQEQQAQRELQEFEESKDRQLTALDQYHQDRIEQITKQALLEAEVGGFANQEEAQAAIQARLLSEFERYLQQRIALLEQFGEDVTDLETQLSEIQLGKIFEGSEDGPDPSDEFLTKLTDITSAAGQVIDQFYSLQENRAEAAYDKQLRDLEAAKNKELARYQNDARQRERIEAEFAQKQEELDKRYRNREKTRAISQSLIDTALATVAALATPPAPNIAAATLAGVLGGIQTAIISAQTFAKGGYRISKVSSNPAGPVNEPTLFVAGEEGPEWIAPNWMLNHPDFGSQIRALEGARIRGFADGGFTDSPPLPSDNAVTIAGLNKQDLQIRLLRDILTAVRAPSIAAVITEKNAMEIQEMQQDVQVRRSNTALT